MDTRVSTVQSQNLNSNSQILLVGSSNDCQVVIRDSSVSPHHLTITRLNKQQYQIEDIGSDEGTYVKGQQITTQVVNRNDIIQIGSRPVEIRWLASHFDTDMPEHLAAFAGTSLLVGSSGDADIILPYPDISPVHAELMVEQSGNVLIADKGSAKGTFLNGIQVRSRMQLTTKDSLYLGSFRVQRHMLEDWIDKLVQMGELYDDSEPTETDLVHETTQTLDSAAAASGDGKDHMAKVRIPEQGTLIIGRDPDADVFINHPSLSWHHARLIVRGNHWVLTDQGSANGTYVDGEKITKKEVSSSSWIRVGAVFLMLSDDVILAEELDPSSMRLDVVHLGKKLPSGKTLLNDISFSVYPGEVVALMGPSGAGKTALLECLTGKKHPTKGKVYLNGESLHKNWNTFRHSIGYVPQEDVMHRDLTVYETLYFAAKMRLPRDLPEEMVVDTVEHVMIRMGLANIRDSIIGDEQVRGISGGQRKRVNIALELITEPSLLFLDEPTSGLDGTSTLEILQILRSLANAGAGKTIILTIHQPRIEAYKLVDNLILLVNGGRLVYYGPAYPDAPEYFSGFSPQKPYVHPTNPADYVIDLLDSSIQSDGTFQVDWMSEFQQSNHFRRFVRDRLSTRKEIQTSDEPVDDSYQRKWISQYWTLCRRYCRRRLRDRSSLIIQLAQTPIIGGILGWLFFNEGYAMQTKDEITAFKHEGLLNMIQLDNGIHASLFLMGAAAFWFGCSNVAREIVSERAIYLRERRWGLRIGAYLASIFTYQFALAAVQTFLITTILWTTVNFSANFFAFWGVLQLIAGCGVSLGLLVSASSKTEVTAISMIPILLLPQLMLGGFIKLYGYLLSDGFQGVIADIMPIRWAFEALSVLEYTALQSTNEHVRDLSDVIGFSATNLTMSCSVLVGFTLLFSMLTLVRLQFWESKS